MDREIEKREYLDAVKAASWFLRLPVIRHIRAVRAYVAMERHYRIWYSATGALPINKDLDQAVVRAIWKGEK